MPLVIRKLPNKELYKVYNKETKKVHSYATTLENAKRQVSLLKDIDNKNNSNKKKIFSNNNMPNSWVSYVKEYASKNGMSYRDALRDPKCKAGYKTKGPKGHCRRSVANKSSKKVVTGMGVIDESEFADQALLADAYNSNELGANAGKKYISL